MPFKEKQNTPKPVGINKHYLQLLVFLLAFPLANLLFVSTVLVDFGFFDSHRLINIAIKIWPIFFISLLVIRLLEKLVPTIMQHKSFWLQLLIHVAVIVGIASFFTPILEPPFAVPITKNFSMARLVVVLEIVVYLVVLRFLNQQQHAFATAMTLKETELNMLRSQSNPHFLFNTLNLITSEISNDPENAKDIVFDLADLLRSNIKMAQQSVASVSDEIRLVTLYLTLQQKRFKNRLTFSVNVADNTKTLNLPALLLQPVVENTIKHAVAPNAASAHIEVTTLVENKQLHVAVKDSGPAFDDTRIVEGNGFRILRDTLTLHYGENYDLQLTSTPTGGRFTLKLPIADSENKHEF